MEKSKIKYIFIILVCLLISCDDTPVDYTHVKPQIQYVEKYCPRCNGIGEVELTTGERVLWGVFTFGGGFAMETMECSMCNGTGVVKVRKLKQ